MSAISKQQRVKGQIFLDEAAKVLAKRTWLASSSEQKFEDAAEQYQRAGNAFKIGGFHNDAGDAYRNAAKIYTEHLKNLMEASKCLKDAGECQICQIFCVPSLAGVIHDLIYGIDLLIRTLLQER